LNCTLRPATPSDALCISALATQVFLDTYATDGMRDDLAREVERECGRAAVEAWLADAASRILLAERDGHLIAFALWRLGVGSGATASPEEPQRDDAELVRLYVQRHFHGHGIGHMLLSKVETDAGHAGSARLWLTAWVGNAKALAFYAKEGYVNIGSTDYVFEGRSYENRVFEKVL
jgi:GNAT superfamily N-acetyltransferase